MADEKGFKDLTMNTVGIGKDLGVGGKRPPYIQIGELIGITFSAKNTIPMMRAAIIASNAANPTRDFAEILKKMPADEPKPRVKKSTPVIMHVDAVPEVLGEEKKSPEPMTYTLCDTSLSAHDALSEQIHAIHNFLRNRGVGYGMSALKVFNLFYGLARIEQYDLFSMIGLDVSCKFSELVKMARQTFSMNVDISANAIYELTDQYQDKINAIQMTRKFMMSELPDNISNDTIARLVIDIDRLISDETQIGEQICGKIYEYFIGRDQTAISEMGAYFTNRRITQFIYDQLAPELDADGKVQSMIDPFGGSGGFTTGYVMNLNKRFECIDWKDGLSRVYHFDMNNDVVRYAALELMCLTKALPNMCDNMICENSFASERFKQYQYVCTNPPYGGDKTESVLQKTREILKDKISSEISLLTANGVSNTVNAGFLKRRELQLAKVCKEISAGNKENDLLKVKTDSPSTSHFIKNYARKNGLFTSESRLGRPVLFGNDKEATSLILIAALVAPGGTAVGVLKEGVFFDGTYKLLRKHLIEKFNVRRVISVPRDQFENTTTKTSIIIFDNDPIKKTSRIDFSELKVTKWDHDEFGEDANGDLVVIGIKNSYQEITEHPVSTANLSELQKEVESKKGNKVTTKQLWSLDGTKYSLRVAQPGPGYKMINMNDVCDFLPKSKRAASFGKSNGIYEFYSSSPTIKRCDIADRKDDAIIIGTGGNSCLHLASNYSCSGDTIQLIAKPSYNRKYIYYSLLAVWESFVSKMTGSTIKHVNISMVKTFRLPFPESEAKMVEWTAKISKAYDERLTSEMMINDLEQQIKINIAKHTQAECDVFVLGDSTYFDIIQGTRIVKSRSDRGDVPVYGGGGATFSTDTYNRDKNTLIISVNGISEQCVRYVRTPFYLNSSGASLDIKDVNIRAYVVAYMCMSDTQRRIYAISGGSIQHNIQLSELNKIEILIPKNKTEIASIVMIMQKIDILHEARFNADIQFKDLIKLLAREAIVHDV